MTDFDWHCNREKQSKGDCNVTRPYKPSPKTLRAFLTVPLQHDNSSGCTYLCWESWRWCVPLPVGYGGIPIPVLFTSTNTHLKFQAPSSEFANLQEYQIHHGQEQSSKIAWQWSCWIQMCAQNLLPVKFVSLGASTSSTGPGPQMTITLITGGPYNQGLLQEAEQTRNPSPWLESKQEEISQKKP